MLESYRISSTRRLCRRHISFQFHRHWSKPSFLPSLDGQRCSLEASIHVNSVKLVSFQHFERSRLARRRHQLHPWIWSTYRRRKKSKNLFLTFLIFIFWCYFFVASFRYNVMSHSFFFRCFNDVSFFFHSFNTLRDVTHLLSSKKNGIVPSQLEIFRWTSLHWINWGL